MLGRIRPSVGPLVIAEAAVDDEAAQCRASICGREDLAGLDLRRGDPREWWAAGPWHSGQAQFPVADTAGVVEHRVACPARKPRAVERREARLEALQVCIELDRVAVEDEHRLEDALAGVGMGGG